jgi:hypothetical protein
MRRGLIAALELGAREPIAVLERRDSLLAFG